MTPTINFDLEDFEELGDIRDLIERASGPLRLDLIDLERINNETGLNLNVVNAIGFGANIILSENDRLEALNNIIQSGINLTGAIAATEEGEVSPESLNELANSIASPILNFDNISAQLDNVSNTIQSSNSLINSPINVQANAEDDIAVVFNEEIRGDVVSTVADINSSLNIFSENQNSVSDIIGIIENYQNNLNISLEVTRELQRQLVPLAPAFGKIPAVYNQILIELALAEQNIFNLRGQTSLILNQANEFQSNLESRGEELEVLRDYFDFLLTVELDLEAEWNAGATSASDPRYQIIFQGNRDLPNSIELEGAFPLGELFVRNNTTVGGGSTAEPIIDFFLTRTVRDPILGSIVTPANTQLVGTYQSTRNTDNPRESADIIQIPDLGINVNIFEEDTYGPLTVFARYDSPLEIVAIEPAPNAEGGFITPFGEEEPTVPVDENPGEEPGDPNEFPQEQLLDGDDFPNNIAGTDADETINGFGGNDTLNGGNGNDTINGGDGDDLVNTNQGNHLIDGGDGNDTLNANSGDDTVSGGNGNDIINSGDGQDILDGGDGNDTLAGGGGDDSVAGGLGDDLINGDNGNDTLIGGSGTDRIVGGGGNDVFVLTIDNSFDTFSDFNREQDFIGLSDGLTFDELVISGGNSTSIDYEGNTIAVIPGLESSRLNADRFIEI